MPQLTWSVILAWRQLYTALHFTVRCYAFRTLYQTFHDNWQLDYLPWMFYGVQGMSSRKHRCTLFVGGWISLFRGYFRGHHSTQKEIFNWSKLKPKLHVVNKMDFCKNKNEKNSHGLYSKYAIYWINYFLFTGFFFSSSWIYIYFDYKNSFWFSMKLLVSFVVTWYHSI